MAENPQRRLPAVHAVLSQMQGMKGSHAQAIEAIRLELANLREQLKREPDLLISVESVARQSMQRLSALSRSRLREVINATGIILHTNLGRAPLSASAIEAVSVAARNYTNLEIDLESGHRSNRVELVRSNLSRLIGSESATVVNNCAAATVLTLKALASGREVIVSRGELIEIGGGFRIPEIMQASGCILREVGTTNITRLSDYEQAIGPSTALLMRIHSSNFIQCGHVSSPSLGELASLSKKYRLPLIDDVGSGAMVDLTQWKLSEERMASESISTGADLVLFSGDKLLGGPQCGIIAGRKELIEQCERDPLFRAFRVDKLTLAGLDQTVLSYLNESAFSEIPILRMMSASLDELRDRAIRLAEKLHGINQLEVSTGQDVSQVGGGSLPGQSLATAVIRLRPECDSEEKLASRLRNGEPAILTRLNAGMVIIDLRTIPPERDLEVVQAIREAASGWKTD